MGFSQYIEINRLTEGLNIFDDIEFDNEIKSRYTPTGKTMTVTKMWKILTKNFIFNTLINRSGADPCRMDSVEIGKDEIKEMKSEWKKIDKYEFKELYYDVGFADDECFEEDWNVTKNILNQMKKLCKDDNTFFVYTVRP